MKKTILLLLMFTIITGNLLTACGPDVVDPNAQDDQVQVIDDSVVKVEMMDSDAGEQPVVEGEGKGVNEDETKVQEPKEDEVKVEDKPVVEQPKVEEPKTQEPKVEPPKEEEPKVEQPKEPEIQPSEPVKDPEPVTLFIDGSYSQIGGYQSPAGPETISVSLTVKGDTVTDVTVTPNASHPTSQKFQGLFASGISGQVVGKKLDELGGFSQVNGSSLTPTAFNQALASIKAQAKK